MKRTIEDYLRLAEISNRFRNVFELWGYREVLFPAIEEYSGRIRKGTKFAYDNGFYLINPDPTSRIIKEFADSSMRLFYITEVLNGGIRGEWQAGVEMIGFDDMELSVEPILVAITAMEALGIEEFYVDVGSLSVWKEAISDIPEFQEVVFTALTRRNFELVERLPITREKKDLLWDLFNFRGRESGFEKLDRVVRLIGDERVFIDLGTVRPLPYYTDLIFEIYSPKLGRPLGGGGEYSIGSKKAAGFYLDIGVISKLYSRKERQRALVAAEDTCEAYRKARKFVKLGIPVEVRR